MAAKRAEVLAEAAAKLRLETPHVRGLHSRLELAKVRCPPPTHRADITRGTLE